MRIFLVILIFLKSVDAMAEGLDSYLEKLLATSPKSGSFLLVETKSEYFVQFVTDMPKDRVLIELDLPLDQLNELQPKEYEQRINAIDNWLRKSVYFEGEVQLNDRAAVGVDSGELNVSLVYNAHLKPTKHSSFTEFTLSLLRIVSGNPLICLKELSVDFYEGDVSLNEENLLNPKDKGPTLDTHNLKLNDL